MTAVGDFVPEVGTVFQWDIAEILTRPSADVGRWSEDQDLTEEWENLLEEKRNDSHYGELKEAVLRDGFTHPCTANGGGSELLFGDGHHRLAIAIDLGLPTVPVRVHADWAISYDSGSWYEGPARSSEAPLPRPIHPAEVIAAKLLELVP